ncbi:MAG: M67 family metallopeptidase [Oscillospiraceae bacterium]|nr:M67 family metallopeptidase [Oscillospiraceae bacterium]
MIRLSSTAYRQIVDHALAGLPNEACGLLAGTESDGVRDVRKVFCLTNIDHSNEHFSMDPREQLAALRQAREEGLTLLGNWHSHPESPSRPSEEDIRLAYDSTASYLILSLQSRQAPNLNAFRIQGGAYAWDILELYDPEP